MVILIYFLSHFLWAQDFHQLHQLTDESINILTTPQLLNSQNVTNVVDLENLNLKNSEFKNSCENVEVPSIDSCQYLTSEDMPKNLKEQNFRILFEIKYQPLESVANYTGTFQESSFYQAYDLTQEFMANSPATLTNFMELKEFAKSQFPHEGEDFIQNASFSIMIQKLQQTQNYNDMMEQLRQLSQGMSETEKVHFLASLGSFVSYNYDRSEFIQEEGAGLGRVGPFEQIIGTQSGICGDIAAMTAKFAENLGYEAFTIGYAMDGSQHVVTGVVDKKTNKFTVLNYGTYADVVLDEQNSNPVIPQNPEVFPGNSSIQYRIFKNTNSGSDGKMQSIASIPTELGTFMSDLFYRQKEFKNAMEGNENYQKKSVAFEYDKKKVIEKNNGDLVQKNLGEGVIVYEGKTSDAMIYGVAVNHHVFKNIFSYDPNSNRCIKKKSGYFSLGMANSLISGMQNEYFEKIDTYHVYLNMRGGKIWHFIDSEYFKFQGILGYEFDGFASFAGNQIYTGDVNLKTFAGLIADYQKNQSKLHFAIRSEHFVGLKDQNLMTDFSALPQNIAPLAFNASSLDVNYQYQLNEQLSLLTDNRLTISRVGGRVLLSAGILTPKNSLMLSYQNGFHGYKLGNNLQHINLLPTSRGRPDGVYVDYNQYFINRKKTFSGNAGVYVGLGLNKTTVTPNIGGTLKINIGKPKK